MWELSVLELAKLLQMLLSKLVPLQPGVQLLAMALFPLVVLGTLY